MEASEPAIWQLIAAERTFLVRVTRLHVPNGAMAEDIVQETLAAALEGAASYGGKSTLRTWLVGILKYKILDALRDKKKHGACVGLEAELTRGDFDPLFDESGTWNQAMTVWADPYDAAVWTDFARVLQVCLDHLPANTARIFMLREFLELETGEICEMTALSPANVRILLYRARMGLRVCLNMNWFERDANHGTQNQLSTA